MNTSTADKRTIRAALQAGHFDKVTCRSDRDHNRGDLWIVKRTYFYRKQTGFESPQAMGDTIVAHLNRQGIEAFVQSSTDKFNAWPKDSYYEVRLTARVRPVVAKAVA